MPIPRRYWAVLGVWMALIVSVLDASIANVALPSIAHDLKTTPADSIAVVSSFQLGALVSLLPLAALGEVVTYRRVFLGGLALLIVASLGCILSHSLFELVLSRAAQGIGAAGIMSVNGALARHIHPHRLLGAALGSNALIVAGFGALGPTIAAAILSWGPWQWLFLVNLPIGLIALGIGIRTLPESTKSRRKLDALSIVLNVVGLFLVSSGVDLIAGKHPLLPGLSLLMVGTVLLAFLVRRSLSRSHPLFPIRPVENPARPAVRHDFDRDFCGADLAPRVIAVLFSENFAVQSGHDRMPVSTLAGSGLLVMTAGLIAMLCLPGDSSAVMIGLRLGICGVGFGFFQAPNNRALMSSAPIDRAGAAAGLIAISRVTGQISGAMLVALLFRIGGPVGRMAMGLAVLAGAFAAFLSFARRGISPSDDPIMVHRGGG